MVNDVKSSGAGMMATSSARTADEISPHMNRTAFNPKLPDSGADPTVLRSR